MKNKKLTVIIPFLNEGEEVENTIKSITNMSKEEIDIIVINDASDDNYDYRHIPQKYDVVYLENEQRKGISSCRNIGVEKCKTPFFLLLDAHMRFYDSNWTNTIVSFLSHNETTLVCCQTKELRRNEDGIICTKIDRPTSYGAYVDFYNRFNTFEPIWIFDTKQVPNDDVIDIPCVLGAGYAMNKKYWNLLNGLEGLSQYGNDEAYLSIKVWLQGGRCVLLKNVVIGHLYRNKPPYNVDFKYRMFNRIFLSEVLLPYSEKKRIYSILKYTCNTDLYSSVLLLLHHKNGNIKKQRNYYDKIFKKDYSTFEIRNNVHLNINNNEHAIQKQINQIAYKIIAEFHTITDIGLLSGQMGLVLFLFHYAKYINNKNIHELSHVFLNEIFNKIDCSISIDFHSGLCGIGWGLEYLVQSKFIEVDTDEILEDVDKKINEINLDRISDFNLNHGLGGIIHYIIARTQQKTNFTKRIIELNPFYKKALFLLEKEFINFDSFDVFLRFIRLHDNMNSYTESSNLSVYDLLYLPDDVNILNSNKLGLDGIAGLGLNLIWNKTYALRIKPYGDNQEAYSKSIMKK